MKSCQSDYRRYLVSLYGGMLAGLIFMASIACCLGWASSIAELAFLLSICFSTALFCQVVNEI